MYIKIVEAAKPMMPVNMKLIHGSGYEDIFIGINLKEHTFALNEFNKYYDKIKKMSDIEVATALIDHIKHMEKTSTDIGEDSKPEENTMINNSLITW